MKTAYCSVLLAALAAGLGSFGCQYNDATDACYALVDAIGSRYASCGIVATPAEGEQLVIDSLAADGLNCDSSPTNFVDRDEFYDVCIPEIAEMDCTTLLLPMSCDDKLYYRSR